MPGPVRDAVLLAGPSAATPLAGLASIERLALIAAHHGVTSLLLVADRPERAVTLAGRRAHERAAVRAVRTGSPEAGRALERLAAGGAPFLVLDTERAWAPALLEGLLAGELPEGVARAVGPGPDGPFALAVAPASLAPALAGDRPAAALAAALASASGTDRLIRIECSPTEVAALGDDPGRRAAERLLLAAAGKPNDGLVSRHLNRRLSRAVTGWLLRTPIRPNHLTGLTVVLGALAGAALLQGTPAWFLAGAALYQLNSALDGCDGEIARLKFQGTRFGEWFDTLADQFSNLVFFVAAPLGLWRMTGEPLHRSLAVFVGVATAAALVLVAWRTHRSSGAGNFNDYGASLVRALRPASLPARALAGLSALLRRDAYALLFLLLAAAGWSRAVVWLIAGGVALHWLSFLLPQVPQVAPAGRRKAAA